MAEHTMKDMLARLQDLVRQGARQEIMPRFNRVSHSFKADGSLVTEADTAMQAAMIEGLRSIWPDYAILGEEMSGRQQQALLDQAEGGLWVLDPLDGTSNFAAGIPLFSVSLALLLDGEVQLGLVYDPLRDECFSAIREQGAWLNDQPLKPEVQRSHISECIAQVDLKRLPAEMAGRLAGSHPFASQRNFGSGTLDWCWLAAGRAQLYAHGGQKLWDYLAGQLILQEAGGQVTTFEGEPVFDHSLKPRSVVAAVNPTLYALWWGVIKGE